jgi:hypothetical protein
MSSLPFLPSSLIPHRGRRGRPRLLLPLPPFSLLVAGRHRGWMCASSCDLRCSPGLVMAGQPAVDRPSRLVPGPSRLASPSPLPPFARSSASGPPRRDFAARRARAKVRTSIDVCPMFPLSVLPHMAAAPLLVIMCDALFAPLCLYPPCGCWASVVRATCASTTRAARRPLASRPGYGGAGAAVQRAPSATDDGRRAAYTAPGLWAIAGVGRRTVDVLATASSRYRASASGTSVAAIVVTLCVPLRVLVGG